MFWSNLFKKKNKEVNAELVNNTSSKMPSSEELTPEEQEYVNKFKEEYLKFYNTKENYVNLDSELFNEVKIYQDLALDIMHNDHFGNIVNSIIDSKKLVYYSHKITEINNTLKYKYIAINGLRKDKKYLAKYMGLYVLGKRKINILKALDHQMNIINNMFVIADKQIFVYNVKAIANYPKNIDQTTKKELNDRYIEVEKDYKDLFNSSIELDDSISIADEITYMEILIDKFIYENKDLINKLKEQLDLIANSEINDKKMQQEIIDNLMKIKMYYNIFYKYGRNKLTKDDFEDLYQIIFNVYTYFPLECSFIEYYNSLEKNNEKIAYEKIIQSKLEIFKLGKSKIFETLNMPNEELIKWADENYFSKVLPSTDSSLRILLLMDYKDGLEQYFENERIDCQISKILPDLKYDDKNQQHTKYTLYKLIYWKYNHLINKTVYRDFNEYKEYKEYNALCVRTEIHGHIFDLERELLIFKNIYNKNNVDKLLEGLKILNDINLELYCKFLKEKIIYLPKSITEFIFNDEVTKTNCLIIPNDTCSKIIINVNQRSIIENYYKGKILIPLIDNIKIDVKRYIDEAINMSNLIKILKIIASYFVLDYKLVYYEHNDLIKYLNNIFSLILEDVAKHHNEFKRNNIRDFSVISDDSLFEIWYNFFGDLSIMGEEGNIKKIKLTDISYIFDSNQCDTSYPYLIEKLASSIESLKNEISFNEIIEEPKTLIKK